MPYPLIFWRARQNSVDRQKEYRWNSLSYHMQTCNKDSFLSIDFGLKGFGALDAKERLKGYRRYVCEAGVVDRSEIGQPMVIEEAVVKKEPKKEFKISRVDRFRYRTRYFTDSGIIGTKEVESKLNLCERMYERGLQRSRKTFCAFCVKLN